MSGTTITGVHLTTIALNNAATENPATIASGATISVSGTALRGDAGAVWTIANYGLIDGTGNFGEGIALDSGGTVSNAGSVTGTVDGIIISGGAGSVTNASGSSIESADVGINFFNFPGMLDNSGSISAAIGVYLYQGGSVTNEVSGSIEASLVAIEAAASATIVNKGNISSTASDSVGILLDGGALTNAASGSISGALYGVQIENAAGTIVNYGFIAEVFSGDAVYAAKGGSITNAASASIIGSVLGVKLGESGTVVNSGSIYGLGTTGIYLEQGGTISNAASALISGGTFGIFAGGLSSTVINAGTITGGNGTAISFAGSEAHELVIDPGAIFNGAVLGSASASNTLDLASGSNTGTISGLGTAFTNFGTVTLDSGASWDLQGTNTLASGATVSGSGALTVTHGASLTDTGNLINDGNIAIDRASVDVGSLSGTGTVTINFGSELGVQGPVSDGQDIVFGGEGILDINAPTQFDGTISGFDNLDTIDLTSTPHTGGHVDMDDSDNILAVVEGGHIYTFQFDPSQNFTGDFFHLSTDGGGTDITMNTTPCYCAGTLIRTARGQQPVEGLKIGDRVQTASGALRPIKWIGTRSYAGRFVTGRQDILPVCIRAGALDENVPRRDLWISPHHAMFFRNENSNSKSLDGVLIEATDLVNGVSIVQAERVDKVEYFHIETDSHDVIVAEGALSETFIDDNSRALFHNAQEYRGLYPDAADRPACYCAPRLKDGHALERIRQHIALRAGLSQSAGEPLLDPPSGCIDEIGPKYVAGWAQESGRQDAPVCLDIYDGDRLIGRTLANRHRDDLRQKGIGGTHHGFVFNLPAGTAPDAVRVCRTRDGASLKRSAACGNAARTGAAA